MTLAVRSVLFLERYLSHLKKTQRSINLVVKLGCLNPLIRERVCEKHKNPIDKQRNAE